MYRHDCRLKGGYEYTSMVIEGFINNYNPFQIISENKFGRGKQSILIHISFHTIRPPLLYACLFFSTAMDSDTYIENFLVGILLLNISSNSAYVLFFISGISMKMIIAPMTQRPAKKKPILPHRDLPGPHRTYTAQKS